jgi:hypothetical protein
LQHTRVRHRNNNFGNHGAQQIWAAFMALVIWIAIHIWHLEHLKVYTNHSFSFEFADGLKFYKLYNTLFPTKQTLLLELWDEIGLPHDHPKQNFGTTLTIISFEVNPNLMTFTMSKMAFQEL